MTTTTQAVPFHIQPLLSDLYYSKDLLDFSGAGPSSPPAASGSLLSTAASLAASAGRRATSTSLASASPATGAATNEDGPRKEVNCVEGYDKNVYVGRSDGIVEWWVIDGSSGDEKNNGWTLRHKHTLFPRRAVNKIILLPKVSKCFILSDGTLHAFMLPSLEPLPSTTIQTLRGVVNVVLNDDELDWGGPGSEAKAADMTVIVVRRKGLGVYRVGARMLPVKELPLPSGPTAAGMLGTSLCAAIPSTNTYSLIDLGDMSLTEVLPVSQVEPSELDWIPNANVVVIPGENEFLVTSYTGSTTMGVFLNGQGDPVRGTIEWQHHPIAITTDSGFVLALLRNNTILIHSLADLENPVQNLEVDPSFSPRTLTYSPYGIAIRDLIRDGSMVMARMLLLESKRKSTSTSNAPVGSAEMAMSLPDTTQSSSPPRVASPPVEEPSSGSGLTPPTSPTPFQRQPIAPTRTSSLLKATAPTSRGGPFSTAISETLLVGPNGIQSLSPTSAISRVETCCMNDRLDEAMAIVDEERRKGRRGEIESDKTTHQGTVRFLHLLVASHLMSRGMFTKAGDYFAKGKIDARILVRSFPILRGKLIGSAEEVEVYQGLKDVLSGMPSIEDIVSRRLAKESLDKDEHRQRLLEEANEMLAEFLRKTRTLRRKGGGSRGVDSRKLDMIIDTTLAKLLANSGDTPELLSLLAGSNDCVSSELEPFLEQRPYVLVTVMRIQGKIERVLELLQSIAESERPDPLCPDPTGELAQTLGEISDPYLILRYILWLAPRDADKALMILMNQGSKAGMKLDDAALIDELRKHSAEAARRYLEHVVVSKKSPNKTLHRELLENLFHDAEEQLANDGVKYHFEELDSEYRLRSDAQPYCVFLAEVAPKTPIKMIRLKLLLFLQGSPFFDLNAAAERIAKLDLLKPELAVVLGRLGRNRQALQLLAREIGDSVSAQTFCTQGGEIIPPRVARSVARHVPELSDWAALGEIGRKRRGTVDAKTQEGLVMELLGVYMRDGASTAKQTAALLNAQSVHLDVLEVLALVPPEWPLDVVSSFFQRSIRRQLHDKASGEIVKAISAGQNMETSERYLDSITSIRPHIIRPGPDDPSPGESLPSQPDEGSVAEKEYTSYVEPHGHEHEHGEKYSTPAHASVEKEGFFDQDSVNKELTSLNAQNHGRESLR